MGVSKFGFLSWFEMNLLLALTSGLWRLDWFNDQPGLVSPCPRVINSHPHCSGILGWNGPHVHVVSAEASSKQAASALMTCKWGQFQASKL
jgi:hypothetical protein